MTDTVLDRASTNAVVFDGGTFGTIDTVPESGSFDTSLDHDWLAVTLIAGHDYEFSGRAVLGSGSLNDVAIDLRDSSRTILDSQGVVDAGTSAASMFTYTATSSGTGYLDISAGGSNPTSQTGQYFVTYADAGADTILDTASTNASLALGVTDHRQNQWGARERQLRHLARPRLVPGHSGCGSHLHILGAGHLGQLERCCDRPQ